MTIPASDPVQAIRERLLASLRSGYLFERLDEPLDAAGKRIVRVIEHALSALGSPASPQSERRLKAKAEYLRGLVRESRPGGCQILSVAECGCPLCAIDELLKAALGSSASPSPASEGREAAIQRGAELKRQVRSEAEPLLTIDPARMQQRLQGEALSTAGYPVSSSELELVKALFAVTPADRIELHTNGSDQLEYYRREDLCLSSPAGTVEDP